jgi:inner membrane protein
MLPDVDHRLPGVPHRGPTHSLAFAALVGGGFALVGRAATSAGLGDVGLAAVADGSVVGFGFGFLVGFLTVLAHLLADALTPAGVNFLWPLSGSEYTLSLWPSDNRLANYGLFAAGVFAVAGALALAVRL